MVELSDQQLVERLKRLGFQSGPITDTTRSVYSRHLQRLSTAPSPGSHHLPDTVEDKVAECSDDQTAPKLCASNSGGKDIFISYGRGTVCGVRNLKCELERAGYTVWLDEQDIVGGTDWRCMIGEAVKSCRALIALITTKYLTSVHCKNELYMANSCSKPLLPVLLEGSTVDEPGVQYAISSINWILAPDGLSVTVSHQILHSLQTLGIHPLK